MGVVRAARAARAARAMRWCIPSETVSVDHLCSGLTGHDVSSHVRLWVHAEMLHAVVSRALTPF